MSLQINKKTFLIYSQFRIEKACTKLMKIENLAKRIGKFLCGKIYITSDADNALIKSTI